MNVGLCTVLTDSSTQLKFHYRTFLLTFLYSLKRDGKIDLPFHVFHDKELTNLTKESLMKIYPNIIFQEISWDRYLKTLDKHNAKYLSFEAFRLTQYDKVIFFDSDLLVISDISDFVNNFVCDIGMCREIRRPCFNAGMIVIGKKYLSDDIYEDLMRHEAPPEVFGNDQKIYNTYFKDITTIDRNYNTLVSETGNLDKVKILHYIYKPPIYSSRAQMDQSLTGRWLDMYFEMEQKLC